MTAVSEPEAQEPVDPYQDTHAMVERLREGVQDDKEKAEATRSFWRELPILIVIALGVAVILKTFLIQAFFIPSASMRDTLLEGDRVMVNKLAYQFGDLQRGDVIVFDEPFNDNGDGESIPAAFVRNVAEAIGVTQPASEYIKRIIGLPGEQLEVEDGSVMINGRELNEPYLHPSTAMPNFGPVVIPADHVFVMGDNRNQSQDSRYFDAVPVDDIVGRAFAVIWPPSRWSGL